MIIAGYPGIGKGTLANTRQNVIDSENDRYLFKAKRLDNGDWLVGYVIKYGYTGKEKYYIVPSYASDLCAIEVDPSTICQCTGLKDKNDKIIWENDIMVAHLDESYPDDKTYQKVIWSESGFHSKVKGSEDIEPIDRFDQEWFAVIGNIFDNPELLENEEI